jgi:hypothetical protein
MADMNASDKAAGQQGSSYQVIGLDDLRYSQVREGLAYWRSLRGARAFPAREQIEPRAIARILTNTILIKVIEGGADFEFLIVGDEVMRAYRTPLIHRRLSEVAVDIPNSAAWWGYVYQDVCHNRKPWAVRYGAGFDGEAKFSNAEAVLLPLGPTDTVVDHILTFGKRTLHEV